MRPNKLRELLRGGQPSIGTRLHSSWPSVVEAVGHTGMFEVRAVERRVFETALKMGVPARAEINSVDEAGYYLDLGVRHFNIATDLSILFNWWKTKGIN
jgi:hypothetical protein